MGDVMAEHTPGPWKALRGEWWHIGAANGRHIGMAFAGYDGPDTADANARLIAAAPDMEKALEAVDNYTTRTLEMHPGAEVDESWRAVEKQIRAALAKARGLE